MARAFILLFGATIGLTSTSTAWACSPPPRAPNGIAVYAVSPLGDDVPLDGVIFIDAYVSYLALLDDFAVNVFETDTGARVEGTLSPWGPALRFRAKQSLAPSTRYSVTIVNNAADPNHTGTFTSETKTFAFTTGTRFAPPPAVGIEQPSAIRTPYEVAGRCLRMGHTTCGPTCDDYEVRGIETLLRATAKALVSGPYATGSELVLRAAPASQRLDQGQAGSKQWLAKAGEEGPPASLEVTVGEYNGWSSSEVCMQLELTDVRDIKTVSPPVCAPIVDKPLERVEHRGCAQTGDGLVLIPLMIVIGTYRCRRRKWHEYFSCSAH